MYELLLIFFGFLAGVAVTATIANIYMVRKLEEVREEMRKEAITEDLYNTTVQAFRTYNG